MPTYVFRVTKAINEFDAPAGSLVVYRPGDPVAEIQVVRSVRQGMVEYLLKHSSHLQLAHQEPPCQADSPFLTAFREHQKRKQA